MALQSSGALAMSDINVELGNASSAQINMGGTAVRGLSGIASGAIRLGADFYGKANAMEFLGQESFQKGNGGGTFNLTLPTGTKAILSIQMTSSNSNIRRTFTGTTIGGNSMTKISGYSSDYSTYRTVIDAFAINYTGSGTTSTTVSVSSSGGANYGTGMMFAYLSKEFNNTTPTQSKNWQGTSNTINFYEGGIVMVGGLRYRNGTAWTNIDYNAEVGTDQYRDYWLGVHQPTSDVTNQTISSNDIQSGFLDGSFVVSYDDTKFG